MARVSAAASLPASVHEAERCWYDLARWPQWVEGFARVVEVQGEWPQSGAVVVWESGPAGRGRVMERVLEHEPLAGQTLAVEDGSIEGRQTIAFAPAGDGVEVSLALDYALRRRTPFSWIVEPLFIRRAMRASLRGTLERFGAALGVR